MAAKFIVFALKITLKCQYFLNHTDHPSAAIRLLKTDFNLLLGLLGIDQTTFFNSAPIFSITLILKCKSV